MNCELVISAYKCNPGTIFLIPGKTSNSKPGPSITLTYDYNTVISISVTANTDKYKIDTIYAKIQDALTLAGFDLNFSEIIKKDSLAEKYSSGKSASVEKEINDVNLNYLRVGNYLQIYISPKFFYVRNELVDDYYAKSTIQLLGK